MKLVSDKIILAATDLSNHLACKHLTQLSRRVALKELTKPVWNDPLLDVLIERGKEHEADYVQHLKDLGLRVIDLTGKAMGDTVAAMENGAEVLVQAKLENDDWTGYADILLRVPVKSNLGDYSYVVQDTKLAQDTRPGTILSFVGVLLASLNFFKATWIFWGESNQVKASRHQQTAKTPSLGQPSHNMT